MDEKEIEMIAEDELEKAKKADGEADTAQITQSVSDTALPSCEGGTPEQASPLEGLGGEADQGGSTPQRRARP